MAETKALLSAFFIALMISGLAFVGSAHFGSAQSGTNVSGIISSDITWTKANSPYNFVGNVSVSKGVTLTIESGVTVQFSQAIFYTGRYGQADSYYVSYSLQVDGVLHAIGNSNSPINFDDYTGDTIIFSSSSSDSIVQNVDFETFQINVVGSSPKFYLDDNAFINITGGSPTIENDTSLNVSINGGSSIISNNNLDEASVYSGSPTISFNTIDSGGSYGIGLFNYLNQPITAVVTDNNISGSFKEGGIIVSAGTPIIERNFIGGGTIGMIIYGNTSPVIEDNTVAGNAIGLNIYDSSGSPSPTIINNNIEQSSQYNMYLGQQGVYGSTTGNINASYNWWGTTDIPIINQTIYDYKNNNNVGVVTFTPILTSPNPEAVPNPNAPITTPSPTSTQSPSQATTTASSSSPSSSPSQTEAKTASSLPMELLVTGVVTIVIVAVAIGAFLLGKRAERKSTRSVDYQI